MKFTKPALPISAQLAKLKTRGLLVTDDTDAEHQLRHIGYYRLSAYALHFQDIRLATKPFHPGANIDQVMELCRFDRDLRLLVLDAIARTEVSLRSVLNNEMSIRHGTHWYMCANHFTPRFDHARFIADIERELGIETPSRPPVRPHQEVFINHYYAKYTEPRLPPSWMVMETLSLGTLSLLFANLARGAERNAIAANFGADEFVLRNWFHVLSHVRNLCAHHSRLWNRRLVIKFRQVANKHKSFLSTTDRMYAVAVVLCELLRKITPGTDWHKHLRDLLAKHPVTPLAPMGFPANWQSEPFWNFQAIELPPTPAPPPPPTPASTPSP
jgi:abortive infection bacteriophage resistance protein